MTENIDEHDQGASQPSPTSSTPTGEKKRKMYVGLDLGTLQSCIVTKLIKPGSEEIPGELVPTVVGYPEDGILSGILPGNSSMLHGNEAIANELHLRLVNPLSDGVVCDVEAARSFLAYLRGKIDPERKREVLCVIGIPAVADGEAKENLKKAAKGAFDGILFIPEPFLAALGMRDEERLSEPDYQDPVSNSLFIDIGAGTTDFCIVQGYFPKPEDLMSIPFAGNEVGVILDKAIREAYPEVGVPLSMIRSYKESYSYAGESESEPSQGAGWREAPKNRNRKQVGFACNELVQEVFETVKKVIAMASPLSVFSLLQNIVLTGGGSRIRNIDQELQRLLLDDGYEEPVVHFFPRS